MQVDLELWQRVFQVGGDRLRAELLRLQNEQDKILRVCLDDVQMRIAQGRAQAFGKLIELLDDATRKRA